uniref:Uncharacterized protein n=1 Tax=Rhizophora mucronata TaxID=61149 RepID=A0A2P2NRL5_RHIMU
MFASCLLFDCFEGVPEGNSKQGRRLVLVFFLSWGRTFGIAVLEGIKGWVIWHSFSYLKAAMDCFTWHSFSSLGRSFIKYCL